MKKRWNRTLLSLALALLMVVLSVPLAVANGNVVLCTPCGENGQWSLDDQGVLTISGTGEMPFPDESVIELWKDKFDTVQGLVIQSGITSIPDHSFYRWNNIKQVQLPDTLESIERFAFFMLTDMERLTIPESVKTIGNFAFDGCASLKELVIPTGVQTIEDRAFELCLSLESIYNYSATAVTSQCGTFRLKETDFWTREKIVDVARWIAETGYLAMAPLNNTQESQITAEMMQSFNTRFGTDLSAAEYLALIHEVENAGASNNPTIYCYDDSAEKQSCIEKGFNYQTIEEATSGQCGDEAYWSFDEATGTLTVSGTGPMWDKAINTNADTWEGPENAVTSGEWNEEEANKWAVVSNQATTVIFEDGVTTVGAGLFFDWSSNNENLQKVVLANSVLEVGECAFSGCFKLTDLTLSNSLRIIHKDAFSFCYALPEVILPESLETICEFAFDQCVALKEIVIPENVEKIECAAFSDSPYLDKITVLGKNTVLEENALGVIEWRFENLTREQYLEWAQTRTEDELVEAIEPYQVYPDPNDPDADYSYFGTIYCYSGSTAEAYAQQYGMDYQLLDEEVSGQCGDNLTWTLDGDGTLTISGTGEMWNYDTLYEGGSASDYLTTAPWGEHYHSRIKKVVVNDGVMSVGAWAFSGCTDIEEAMIGNNVTTLGAYAFYGCEGLASIALGDHLMSIGDSAFRDTALSNVVIPDSVINIWSCAFIYCNNLASVVIGNGVETISDRAFCGCNNLASVVIGQNVSFIGEYAFFDDGITDVYYGASETAWGQIEIKDGNEPLQNANMHFAHEHVNTYVDTTPSSCTVQGVKTVICLDCGAVVSSEVLPLADHEWDEGDTIEASTCTVAGTALYRCKNCTATKEEALPLAEHTWDAGVIKTAATYLAEGEMLYTCTLCPATKTEVIEKLIPDETKTNEENGISVSYQDNVLPADLQVTVDQLFDGVSFKAINREIGNVKTSLFNITLEADGNSVQPAGLVLVKLPIPEGYNKNSLSIYYISNDGTTHLIPSYIDGDYICFETDHFSEYAIVDSSQQADPLQHAYTAAVTTEPTCEEEGIETYTCSHCGDSYTKPIAKVAHDDADNDGKCDTCETQMTGGDHCPRCGKIHNRNFFDKLTGFFHKIIYRLTHLFGR